MKIFLSYTIRDGLVNEQFLRRLESEMCKYCNVYIDLIHNKSINPQEEVVEQLLASDYVIQIVSPAIHESKWATLERWLAKTNNIPIIDVKFSDVSYKQLISDITEIVAPNNRIKLTQNIR